jgi:hypothetical protein
MNPQPAPPLTFEGAERHVELDIDDIVRHGRRRKRTAFALVGTSCAIVLIAVTGAAVSLSTRNSSAGNSPLASARGLFPQHLFANNVFGGPKNQIPTHLVAAVAQVPGRQSFTWTLPEVRSGGEWLYVYCTGGHVSVIIGASTTSGPCRGITGVTGWNASPVPGQTITVRVDAPQSTRWGAAVYLGRDGI